MELSTGILIDLQFSCQPICSHVGKSLLNAMDTLSQLWNNSFCFDGLKKKQENLLSVNLYWHMMAQEYSTQFMTPDTV